MFLKFNTLYNISLNNSIMNFQIFFWKYHIPWCGLVSRNIINRGWWNIQYGNTQMRFSFNYIIDVQYVILWIRRNSELDIMFIKSSGHFCASNPQFESTDAPLYSSLEIYQVCVIGMLKKNYWKVEWYTGYELKGSNDIDIFLKSGIPIKKYLLQKMPKWINQILT